VACRIESVETDAACVGMEQAADQGDEGGLAGAVGAKQTEKLPALNVQVRVLKGGIRIAPIGLAQPVDLEEWIHRWQWGSGRVKRLAA